MRLRERVAFWAQMRADFEHTGAVQPSSRFLARAMVVPLRERRTKEAAHELRILEIGPGTGSMTRAAAACMGPEDELVCYEINPEFAGILRRALADEPSLARVADRTTIHNAPVQDMSADERFDVAICSAPLNNFDAETIEAIFSTMIGALHPGGSATLFEYLLFPAVRRALARGAAADRLRRAEETKSRWLSRYARGTSTVLRNLPPARVHRLTVS